MKRTMMKSATTITLALVAAFSGAQSLQVSLNGSPVTFNAAQPQMIGGRVLVPLRGIFEQMGANVDWDPSTQSVIADGNGRHVRLQIGSFDASVNGRAVTLDVVPTVINGTTMVPLRFIGESLGARVDWQPQNDTVAITSRPQTDGVAQRIVTPPPPPPQQIIITPPPQVIIERPAPAPVVATPAPPPPPPPFRFEHDTVIPVSLDEQISSNGSHSGDKITATVRGDAGRYLDFPDGTILEGTVFEAAGASGSHAGTLDVRFTHIRFPGGNRYKIDGYLTPLNDKHIVHTADGRFVAKAGAEDNIAKDAEIGAGAGLVIGAMHGKIVGGAVVGGSIGAVVGVFDHSLGRNVSFDQGTRFGLVLEHDLMIDRHDLHDRG